MEIVQEVHMKWNQYVRVLSHHILIILLSAITPNDGAHIATSNAATITDIGKIASAVHSVPRILVVEIPFASANKYANHAGNTAVVTDVSKALFPNHKHNILALFGLLPYAGLGLPAYDGWAVFLFRHIIQ